MALVLYFISVLYIGLSILAPVFRWIPFHWYFVASGILMGTVFAALARILENQEVILNKLETQESRQRKIISKEKKVCPKCSTSYDLDYNSCPNCGHKEQK